MAFCMSIFLVTLDNVVKIFKIFHDIYPNPKIPLNFVNDYTFAVAVLLSAQTTDEAVNKATARLFKIAYTPEKMLEIGENELKNFIKSLGLYNNKAKNVIAMSEMMIEKFDSKLPTTREKLEMLPGIGRKSANVLLNNIFKIPSIAVDTHVKRLSNRIGLSDSDNLLKIENDLTIKIPQQYISTASITLQTHGRIICLAKSPKCVKCQIAHLCKKNNVVSKYN